MKERFYTLDKEKTTGISAGALANKWGYQRQRVWAWLKGINDIPESEFTKLVRETERLPSDLLTQESLEFLSNASISS